MRKFYCRVCRSDRLDVRACIYVARDGGIIADDFCLACRLDFWRRGYVLGLMIVPDEIGPE